MRFESVHVAKYEGFVEIYRIFRDLATQITTKNDQKIEK